MTNKPAPTKFDDLSVEELRRTAIEDFAVDVKANDNKKTVLAALVEGGVDWKTYATLKGIVVDTTTTAPTPVAAPAAPAEVKIITAEPIPQETEEKYLIKMERANPLYETRGYRFTAEHPYALVAARHADYILTKEIGFRMAFPSELKEYYG